MARKHVMRTKEEKLSIVKRNLTGEVARSLAGEIAIEVSQSWLYSCIITVHHLNISSFQTN